MPTVEATKPGRVARRRAETRKKLLTSAFQLMSANGIEGTSVKEVTEHADIGYGTFFTFFETKDELVLRVLDCLINDIGRRNDLATAEIKGKHPAAVVATSLRLLMQELRTNPIWKWLLQRPDLMVERMRAGLQQFGSRDFTIAISKGRFKLKPKEFEIGWSMLIWMVVGSAEDIYNGYSSPDTEAFHTELMMRAMGVSMEDARRLSKLPIPDFPPQNINFSFILETES